jgi:hypothetical protein
VLDALFEIPLRGIGALSSTMNSLSSLACWSGEAVAMSTPKDVRPASGMGTPNDVPVELHDAVELSPLPVETSPGYLRLVPKAAPSRWRVGLLHRPTTKISRLALPSQGKDQRSRYRDTGSLWWRSLSGKVRATSIGLVPYGGAAVSFGEIFDESGDRGARQR